MIILHGDTSGLNASVFHLSQELRRYVCRQREQEAAEVKQPMVMRYPLPYPQDPSPPPLVPQQPAELQFGNPYSTDTTRGGAVTVFHFCFSLFCTGPRSVGLKLWYTGHWWYLCSL